MFDAETASERQTLRDLSCDGCGYNLRGLDPAGKCPECGLDVAASVQAERHRRRNAGRLPPPSLETAKRWLVGCAMAGVAFVMIATVAGLRHSYFSSAAAEVVCIAAAWVIAWAAIWLWTSAEPRLGRGGDRPAWRWTIRLTSSAYLAALCVWAFKMHRDRPLSDFDTRLLFQVGVVAVLFTQLRLAFMVDRVGTRLDAFLAVIAVFVMSCWALATLQTYIGSGAKHVLDRLPNPLFSSPGVTIATLQGLLGGRMNNVVRLVFAPVLLINLPILCLLSLRLAKMMVAARRATAGRNAASSSP